jgi:hypothetical protein
MSFVTAVVNDVVPMIDKTYRTIPTATSRHGGLSLSGTKPTKSRKPTSISFTSDFRPVDSRS